MYDTNYLSHLVNGMEYEQEIRAEKVKLAKERIKSGYYNKREVISKVADKILKELGFV